MPFCPNCGKEIPSDALFCPVCGNEINPELTVERKYYGEKFQEKREKGEKNEKKEKHEKQEKDEKHEDIWGTIFGGSIIIWLGITLWLGQANLIDWEKWWAYFIFGLGILLLIQGTIRYISAKYKAPIFGSFIGGLLLIVIGLVYILGIFQWWWLIFLTLGLILIIYGLLATKRTPKL